MSEVAAVPWCVHGASLGERTDRVKAFAAFVHRRFAPVDPAHVHSAACPCPAMYLPMVATSADSTGVS